LRRRPTIGDAANQAEKAPAVDHLFAKVLPLGIASAINPASLAMTLVILSGKDYPRLKVLAFLTGEVVVAAVLTAIGLWLAGDAVASGAHGHAVIDTVLGSLLLVLSVAALAIKPSKGDSILSRLDSGPEPRQVATCGLMGLLALGMNVSSQVPFLTAVREVGRSDVSFAVKGIALTVAWILLLLSTIQPLVVSVIAPKAAVRLTTLVSTVVMKYGRFLVAAICLILGAHFMWRGIEAL
jgi:hypothetical protein